MPAPAAVLVIDDDPVVRQFVELVLGQAGYTVSSATTGELGVKALQTARWDLVLLDINIPGMTGLEVLRLLRKYQKVKAAVMMMTSRGDLATVRQAMETGADGYMVKPFGPQDLLKRVEAMLNPDKFRAAPKDDDRPPLELD
ncbi:response regulator transcription factor [Caulobacter sp. 1776]|uniref:response regulator transcription factor n=1 Tax=Caulobacter sp. 1776 TaxID=3156420 RepID=UPI0033939E44